MLPYGYAKRFGVLLRDRDGKAELCCREDMPVNALSEVQRKIGSLPALVRLNEAEFTAAMALAYEQQRAPQPKLQMILRGLIWPVWPMLCPKRPTCWSRRTMPRLSA